MEAGEDSVGYKATRVRHPDGLLYAGPIVFVLAGLCSRLGEQQFDGVGATGGLQELLGLREVAFQELPSPTKELGGDSRPACA